VKFSLSEKLSTKTLVFFSPHAQGNTTENDQQPLDPKPKKWIQIQKKEEKNSKKEAVVLLRTIEPPQFYFYIVNPTKHSKRLLRE
jgi:hypothetical protein